MLWRGWSGDSGTTTWGGAGTPRRGRAPDEGSRKEKMLRELGEEKGEQRSIMNTEVESGLGPD